MIIHETHLAHPDADLPVFDETLTALRGQAVDFDPFAGMEQPQPQPEPQPELEPGGETGEWDVTLPPADTSDTAELACPVEAGTETMWWPA